MISKQFLRLFHLIAIVLILLFPVCLYSIKIVPHSAIHNRMSINVVLLAVCYFLIIKHIRWPERIKSLCYEFARHSFGIYLVHILIMRKVVWPLLAPLELHYALQIPLVVISTALLSYLVVHIFSMLPGSKYVVGL